MSKKHRVSLEVTYQVDLLLSSEDEEEALIQVEKFIAKCDDYDVVNRAHSKEFKIEKVTRMYPESKSKWDES